VPSAQRASSRQGSSSMTAVGSRVNIAVPRLSCPGGGAVGSVVVGGNGSETRKRPPGCPGGLGGKSSRCYEEVTWDRRGRGLWKWAGPGHGIDHEPLALRSLPTPPT